MGSATAWTAHQLKPGQSSPWHLPKAGLHAGWSCAWCLCLREEQRSSLGAAGIAARNGETGVSPSSPAHWIASNRWILPSEGFFPLTPVALFSLHKITHYPNPNVSFLPQLTFLQGENYCSDEQISWAGVQLKSSIEAEKLHYALGIMIF